MNRVLQKCKVCCGLIPKKPWRSWPKYNTQKYCSHSCSNVATKTGVSTKKKKAKAMNYQDYLKLYEANQF